MSVHEHIENLSFPNYNLLKVISRERFNTRRKIHFGIVFENDRLRFNLYHNPNFAKLETDFSLGRSKYIDLNMNSEMIIQNIDQYKKFLDILNIITSLDSTKLNLLFDYHFRDLYSKMDLNKFGPIDIIDSEKIDEKKINEYKEILNKFKH